MSQDEEFKNLLKSKHYYKLGEAIDDISISSGAKDAAIAGAKLVGKLF